MPVSIETDLVGIILFFNKTSGVVFEGIFVRMALIVISKLSAAEIKALNKPWAHFIYMPYLWILLLGFVVTDE